MQKACYVQWQFCSKFKDSLLGKYAIAETTLPAKEADAFMKAIRKDEIPPEYKHLKIIAKGNTSLILEKDPETVVMITRDAMKKDWLDYGIGIAKDWKIHDIVIKSKKFKDFPVYAIEMPRLYPLDAANAKIVNKELKFFDDALASLKFGKFKAKGEVDKIMYYYEQQGKENSLIYKLLEFLTNYLPEQWNWDLARRQFAQTSKGEIILVDPIAETELTKIMHS